MNATLHGRELLVERGVLVPRAETELLGRHGARKLRARQRRAIIDMCCGSGNLACALAAALRIPRVGERPHRRLRRARHDATSVYARRQDRVTWRKAICSPRSPASACEGTIDLVVCNPPYISQAKLAGERAALLENEPREAFDGGRTA